MGKRGLLLSKVKILMGGIKTGRGRSVQIWKGEAITMAIRWVNNYHKGFNRLWLVLSFLAAFVAWISDGNVVKTFLICFAIGHIGFLVVYWIIKGFRKG